MNFPIIRHRRNRKSNWARNLVAETDISARNFIYPIFVHDGQMPTPIKTMPSILRHSLASLVEEVKKARDLGIPSVALFPSIANSFKDEIGSEAFNHDNLICRAIREIKANVDDIGIMADVALDPYTIHGHDGILNSAGVDNDKTVEALVKQSLALAKAGADMIAPSDMMDGRVAAIRMALETEGYHSTQIASYSAKYASNYYAPFRDAVGSTQSTYIDKRSYQMDFRNSEEAMNEIAADINEGADLIIVKPGILYLDILAKAKMQFSLPMISYQVSGEYAMLKLAADNGVVDFYKALHECFMSFRRAGASAIISYAACEYLQHVAKA